MKRLIAYLRVSRQHQEDNGMGLDVQRAAIKEWAKKNKAMVLEEHKEVDISGAAEIEHRTGFLDALSALHHHKADGIIVARRDRLARDVEKAAILSYIVKKAKGRVFCAMSSEEETPESRMMDGLQDLFAQYDRMQRALNTARGKRLAMTFKGHVWGGAVNYGYRVNKATPGVPVIDPVQGYWVQQIFKKRDESNPPMSTMRLARWLDDQGAMRPSGGSRRKPENTAWSQRTVHRIVNNRAFYLGQITQNGEKSTVAAHPALLGPGAPALERPAFMPVPVSPEIEAIAAAVTVDDESEVAL